MIFPSGKHCRCESCWIRDIFSPLLYRLSYLAILIKPKLLESLNGHSCEAAIKPKVCEGVNHGTDTCVKFLVNRCCPGINSRNLNPCVLIDMVAHG